MEGYSIEPEADLDKTDELPVLSVDAILEYERGITRQSRRAVSLTDAIESLLSALENADRRWRSLEAKLDTQNRAIAELQRRLEGESVDEVTRTSIPADDAAPSDHPAIGFAPPIAPVSDDADAVTHEEKILLDRIASLESYIAERSDRWQQMENELSNNTLRIAELEVELAERLGGDPIASAALVCLSSDRGESYSIDKPIFTVGDAPDCDVRITGDFIGVEHAAIRRDDSGTFIEDISGTKALYVNGEQVARRHLLPGDEIEIGAARFRFLIGAESH